jgi:hypothetical protein
MPRSQLLHGMSVDVERQAEGLGSLAQLKESALCKCSEVVGEQYRVLFCAEEGQAAGWTGQTSFAWYDKENGNTAP